MSAVPEEPGSAVPKGAELTVYWPDDDQWYHGVVIATKPGKVHIEYEDGSQEWIHLKTSAWKVWNKEARKYEQEFQNQKKKRIEDLKVGSRLCVFWPFEKTFFAGTLVEMAGSKHLIRYDDGDEEWTNLYHRKFQKVSSRAARLQVGSRIVIHKPGGEPCPATVVCINVGLAKPHCVKYDNSKKKQEWLNLNIQPFHEVQQQHPSQPGIILKKRKQEFLQDMPERQIGKGWKTKMLGEPAEPCMDQLSSTTTTSESNSRSTTAASPVASSLPEPRRPLTPQPLECTPNLTSCTGNRKKKDASPRKFGKITSKLLMNYMMREGCDDESSVMSRIMSLQHPDARLVNHGHVLQRKRK